MDHSLLTLDAEGYLVCFQCLSIGNDGALNICLQYLVKCQGSELLDPVVKVCLFCESPPGGLPSCVPQQLVLASTWRCQGSGLGPS